MPVNFMLTIFVVVCIPVAIVIGVIVLVRTSKPAQPHLPPPPQSAAPAPTASGWVPDPTGQADQRYFDGHSWTDHVTRNGTQTTQPFNTPPTSPPPPAS